MLLIRFLCNTTEIVSCCIWYIEHRGKGTEGKISSDNFLLFWYIFSNYFLYKVLAFCSLLSICPTPSDPNMQGHRLTSEDKWVFLRSPCFFQKEIHKIFIHLDRSMVLFQRDSPFCLGLILLLSLCLSTLRLGGNCCSYHLLLKVSPFFCPSHFRFGLGI